MPRLLCLNSKVAVEVVVLEQVEERIKVWLPRTQLTMILTRPSERAWYEATVAKRKFVLLED
jgi:hypothetical protein